MNQKNMGTKKPSPNTPYPGNRIPGPYPWDSQQAPPSASEQTPPEPAVNAPEPYPTTCVEQPNFNYARMLYQPLASPQSEMTAIYQYLYQSWVLRPKFPAVSELIHRIAAVEMRHLQTLGELIVLLGGNPKCRALEHGGFQFWNGSAPTYSQNIYEMLRNNCSSEEYACSCYQTLAKIIQDPKVSACLSRLAQDEALHARLFHETLISLQNHPSQ